MGWAPCVFFTCSLAPPHSYDMDCTELQCVTGRVRQVEPEDPCTLPALGWCPKLHQKWGPTGFETHLVVWSKMAEFESSVRSSLCSPLMTPFVYATEGFGDCTRTAVCHRARCGKSNRKSMSLAGSRLVPKKAPKIAADPDLKLTLFLVENGGIRDQFALHCAPR